MSLSKDAEDKPGIELNSLLQTHFPQHGTAEPKVHIVNDGSATEAPRYRAKLKLFDQMVISNDTHESHDQAREDILCTAVSILREFISIQQSSLPDTIKPIIESLANEMGKFDSRSSQLPAGFGPVKEIDEESLTKLEGRARGGMLQIVRPSEEELSAATQESVHPVTFLSNIASQSRSSEPLYEFFRQRSMHGCSLSFNGEKLTVQAVFPQKNEAKSAVAKLYCEKHFARLGLTFSGPSHGSAVVETERKHTDTLPLNKTNPETPEGQSQPSDKTQQPSFETGFICKLNMLCQRVGIPMPEFLFDSAGHGAFVCRVKDYAGLSVESEAYAKKSFAKEDAARRIHNLLEEKCISKPLGIPSRSTPSGAVLSPSTAPELQYMPLPAAKDKSPPETAREQSNPPAMQSQMYNQFSTPAGLFQTAMPMWPGYPHPLQYGMPFYGPGQLIQSSLPTPSPLPSTTPASSSYVMPSFQFPGPVSRPNAGPIPTLPPGAMLMIPPPPPNQQSHSPQPHSGMPMTGHTLPGGVYSPQQPLVSLPPGFQPGMTQFYPPMFPGTGHVGLGHVFPNPSMAGEYRHSSNHVPRRDHDAKMDGKGPPQSNHIEQ